MKERKFILVFGSAKLSSQDQHNEVPWPEWNGSLIFLFIKLHCPKSSFCEITEPAVFVGEVAKQHSETLHHFSTKNVVVFTNVVATI